LTRLGVRARLTAFYATLLTGSTAVLLSLSWWLMDRHLQRTLPPELADDSAQTLALQYLLAFIGIAVLAVALGWWMAGRALQPLETSLDAQRRFVANASHELRSPLTVIRTETEVTLADPEAGAEDFRHMGRIVLEATDRTEALLDGLMVLARSQRALMRSEPFSLTAVARRAAAGGMAAARAAGVRIEVDAEGVSSVLGDEALVERLVANLVDNGVRYNAPGGWVVVRAADTSVEVENSGPVVPEDAVERLTEPFERIDRARDSRGTGLGLSIVRAVAEAHGARLEIAARHEGGLLVRVAFGGSDVAV
jgi:signal transduction histidine kinase